MKSFDIHIGLSDSVLESGKDPTQKSGLGNSKFPNQFDFVRAKEGGLALFCGMMCPVLIQDNSAILPEDGVAEIRRHIQVYTNLMRKKELILVSKSEDMDTAGLKVILGIEGLYFLKSNKDLATLASLISQGIKVIGPTWSIPTNIFQNRRLSNFEKNILKLLEQYRVILDLAHSESSIFYNLIENYSGMVIDSHTEYMAVHQHERNISHQQISMIIERNGIVGLSLVGEFVGKNSCEGIYRHVDQFLQDFGDDHLCIGSDFDGMEYTDMLEGLEDVSTYPTLQRYLLDQGIAKKTVQKIFYTNAYNYFKNNI